MELDITGEESNDISDFLSSWGLASLIGVHMALRAALELNIPNIIASSNTQLSSTDIVSRIPTANPDAAATNLDRILRFLASHSLMSVTQKQDSLGKSTNYYGLTRLSRLLASDRGPSCASMVLHGSEREVVESLYRIKDVVLDPEGGGSMFQRAHGRSYYDYASTKPPLKSLFDDVMANDSRFLLEMVFEVYHGFENVKEIMDVGGGNGASLHEIVSAHPHISAINLDLPQTLAHAPTYPGVKHVAGNMFESLPHAETILLKWVLHNWSDEECQLVLRNCWESLPMKGKLIVMEYAIPEKLGKLREHERAIKLDFYMMVLSSGKERTLVQYESMTRAVGFSHSTVFHIRQGFHVMEFTKTC